VKESFAVMRMVADDDIEAHTEDGWTIYQRVEGGALMTRPTSKEDFVRRCDKEAGKDN
jgi:hypothetical protein